MHSLSLLKKVILVLPFLLVISIYISPTNSYAELVCADDPGGVDDAVGGTQRELTMICIGDGTDTGDTQLAGLNLTSVCSNTNQDMIIWNWDRTQWGSVGGDSGDICAFYDTSGNGNANVAYCITVDGTPAALQEEILFHCTKDNLPDRCNPAVEIDSFTQDKCETLVTGDDPFDGQAGAIDPPNDTKAGCCIDPANDLGISQQEAEMATILSVCVFTSPKPNSSSTDCQINPTNGGACANDGQCDDSNICTEDTCVNPVTQESLCVFNPIDDCCLIAAECDDLEICTDDDCVTNACVNVFNEANDETCEPECTVGTEDTDCDDDDICTDDLCITQLCQNPFDGSNDITCDPPPPSGTVIIPTMGQWGMLLAAVVLGIFAIIRLRSIKDSELS